jgi:flagellar biosynthesis/type III secretory pathway chaperone
VDSRVCRETFARLLAEEIQALSDVEQLLSVEHEALLSKNVESLEQTAEVRRNRIGALVRIEDERRSLCRMLGHEPDAVGLKKMMQWCDPRGSLTSQWADRGERAKRCRALNDRNGALVTARLKRVEGLVDLLTAKDQSPATYGPRGSEKGAAAAAASGRLLTIQA